jgi:hypothetical protein
VETLFEQNIAHARSSGNEQAAQMLELHLAVLRECQSSGIAATFERMAAVQGGGGGPSTMPAEQLDAIVNSTIAVMTTVQERRDEWRTIIAGSLQEAQQQGADWQIEVDFFTAVLALLDGHTATLPDDHPYAAAIDAIVQGI